MVLINYLQVYVPMYICIMLLLDCSSGVVKDVVFVIDTSSSIGYSQFQLVRELAENITTSIKVKSPESLFGLITFDDYPRLEFDILRHTDLSTLLPAINPGIPYYSDYNTNTGSALRLLLSGGDEGGFLKLRNEVSNVAIVITNGYPYTFSSLESAAKSLHAANIFDVYAVGIGNNSNSTLQLIASDPSFIFSTFFLDSSSAQQLVQDVIKELCSSKGNMYVLYSIFTTIIQLIHIHNYNVGVEEALT